MASIMDLMLYVDRRHMQLFYHKDTDSFDSLPLSPIEMEHIDPNAKLRMHDENNFRFLIFEEINHKELMRFFVKECVADKVKRKKLFDVLRRDDFVTLFVETLHELDLYEEFETVCGDLYQQIFYDWAEEQGLEF